MRVAVISDVHSNLPALEAVLDATERAGVDETWCLGDVVGYGAEPDACTALVAERCEVCLAGNHDLAVIGAIDIASFSGPAAAAVRWTRERIGAEAAAWLAELEPTATREGIGLFHASPRDPVWEYVLSFEQAEAGLDAQEQRIGLIGHSHVALYFNRPHSSRHRADGGQAVDGDRFDLGSGEWLLNPGSAGQPRDGDPRAAWLELDTEAPSARFHRVEYDVATAAAAILAAGLPPALAARLGVGR